MHHGTRILLLAAALLASAPGPVPPERLADQRMWVVMHQMLLDFGYTNQAQGLNQAWHQNLATDPEPVPEIIETNAAPTRIATACRSLRSLDAALRLACAQSNRPQEIIRGLLQWTLEGGTPHLQGRTDLALHVLYAAAAESALGLGDAVSLAKEYSDRSQGKPFDLDDLAAGMAGAEWLRQAQQNPGWLQAWATGHMSLDKNLPPLRYGTGIASPETLAQIQEEVGAALRGVEP
jgi:hypothetical protein